MTASVKKGVSKSKLYKPSLGRGTTHAIDNTSARSMVLCYCLHKKSLATNHCPCSVVKTVYPEIKGIQRRAHPRTTGTFRTQKALPALGCST